MGGGGMLLRGATRLPERLLECFQWKSSMAEAGVLPTLPV